MPYMSGGTRLEEPIVTGVEFPRVSLNQARSDVGRGELSLQTA